jgi:predicted CXXCH cytochrome family protein
MEGGVDTMKKVLTIGLIVILAVGASYIVYASNVANTKHNLSSSAYSGPARDYYLSSGNNSDRVCVFCHTPHKADATTEPLWNRNYTNTTGFTMYSSSTIDMTIETQPQTVSLACLSCHDGTTAFDALLNFPGSGSVTPTDWVWNGGNTKIDSGKTSYMGKDLSDDHPISITYDPSATGDATEWNAKTGNYVNANGNNLPLYDGRVECGSCHNAHDDQYGTFLRASNAGSAVCYTCHIN